MIQAQINKQELTPPKCSARCLRDSGSRHHICPFQHSPQSVPLPEAQAPSSNITCIMKPGSDRGKERREGDNNSSVPTQSCLRGSHSHVDTRLLKTNQPYPSKESEIVQIHLSLSFVNLSALLCLYSKAHFHSLSTNAVPPCHFSSALENLQFVI